MNIEVLILQKFNFEKITEFYICNVLPLEAEQLNSGRQLDAIHPNYHVNTFYKQAEYRSEGKFLQYLVLTDEILYKILGYT